MLLDPNCRWAGKKGVGAVELVVVFFVVYVLNTYATRRLTNPRSKIRSSTPIIVTVSPTSVASIGVGDETTKSGSVFSIVSSIGMGIGCKKGAMAICLIGGKSSFRISNDIRGNDTRIISSGATSKGMCVRVGTGRNGRTMEMRIVTGCKQGVALSL